MAACTFKKKEKLKSRKQIEALFAKGRSVSVHPIRAVYLLREATDEVAVNAGVSASSRNFKKAVHRNRIKRLLREAYRLNKGPLTDHLLKLGKHLDVFFLYTDKQLPDFAGINGKMQLILEKMIQATRETVTKNS